MKAILKFLKSWTLVVLLIITVSSIAYANTISVSNATGEPNQDFEITISIEDSSRKIESFGFDLEFAADAATYVDYELGELLVGFNEAGAVLIENDTVRVGGFSMDAIENNSSGDLIILKFRAKDAVHDFDFLITGLTDDVVGHEIVGGQFEKFSPPVTPPPTNTPTSTPATSGGFFGSTPSGSGGLFTSSPSTGGTSGGGLFSSTPSGGKTSGGGLFASTPSSGGGLFAASTGSGGSSGGGFFASIPSSGGTSGGGLFAGSLSGSGSSGGGLFTPKGGASSLVSSQIFSSPW